MGDLNEVKILIVDDNNMNLYVINSIIEEMGLLADCVPSGKACLKKVSKKQYSVIFMDHMMPEMDGIETFKKLKEIEGFNVPVIALTANVGEEYEKLYLETGFAGYLPKPVEKNRIKDIVDNFVLDNKGVTNMPPQETSVSQAIIDPRATKLKECGFTAIDDLINDGMPIDEFEMLLSIFKDESQEKMVDAQKYYEEGNMREYAVIVHGLKNDAGMISDMELREHALSHELESKADNKDFVNKEWDNLKNHWNQTLERIDRYFS